jgi:DNA helicase-2/ATP-dependent DNA helicase PcrA
MAVGDDAQSIYSFRGANFRNIMDFPTLFPKAKIIKLEENYRSLQGILDLSNQVISRAAESYTKALFTRRLGEVRPLLIRAEDERMQSRFVSQRILELREDGVNLDEIAVLFRSSFHSFDLELELQRHDIPFVKRGGFKFIETAHIKDALAHLRVIANPVDAVSWLRVLLLLKGVGQRKAQQLIESRNRPGNWPPWRTPRPKQVPTVLPASPRCWARWVRSPRVRAINWPRCWSITCR